MVMNGSVAGAAAVLADGTLSCVLTSPFLHLAHLKSFVTYIEM